MSDRYRDGYAAGMSNQRQSVEPEHFFDHGGDYAAGFAAARAAGWRLGDMVHVEMATSRYREQTGVVVVAELLAGSQVLVRVAWSDGTEHGYLPEQLRRIEAP